MKTSGQLFLVLALSLFLYTNLSSAKHRRFRYSTYLDHGHIFHLSWDVDYRRSLVFFQLVVQADPDQWFGMGFSDYGDSQNADVVAVWTNSQGTNYFQDAFTDKDGILHIDQHQDYQLIDAWSRDGQTAVVFHRKFDTCDDGYVFDSGTTHIISFMADGNPDTISGVNLTSLNPGLQRVQLLKPDIPPPHMPADVWTFEILAPKVRVPNKATTYWWYTTKLPYLRRKHHIIQFEGVIQKGSEGVVHHMEVFHCEVDPKTRIPFFNGPGLGEGTPPKLESCRKVIGAWAMGAKPLPYPDESGYPIGGNHFSRYVLLEVHYNNPELREGIVDQSGIRFHVTSSLRKYDAGIMELGLEYTNKMAIPPGQSLFHLTGDCIQECTEAGLPRNGIKIFASQLHTHLTGKRAYTKHIRRGTELPELNRDNHYSPHFQEIRLLPKPVHVLPGDALVTTCEDSTLDRKNATIGGFAITDEMCLNYVHYYPRVELEVCKSSISTPVLNSFFKFMKISSMPVIQLGAKNRKLLNWNSSDDIDDGMAYPINYRWAGAETSPSKGDRESYVAIRWTPLNVHLLKTLYQTSPLSMQCNMSTGERFPGNWEGMPLTRIQKPLHPPQRPCRG